MIACPLPSFTKYNHGRDLLVVISFEESEIRSGVLHLVSEDGVTIKAHI